MVFYCNFLGLSHCYSWTAWSTYLLSPTSFCSSLCLKCHSLINASKISTISNANKGVIIVICFIVSLKFNHHPSSQYDNAIVLYYCTKSLNLKQIEHHPLLEIVFLKIKIRLERCFVLKRADAYHLPGSLCADCETAQKVFSPRLGTFGQRPLSTILNWHISRVGV